MSIFYIKAKQKKKNEKYQLQNQHSEMLTLLYGNNEVKRNKETIRFTTVSPTNQVPGKNKIKYLFKENFDTIKRNRKSNE